MTQRQELIQQLRYALGELERPCNGDSVVFTLIDSDYEFSEEALDNESYFKAISMLNSTYEEK